MQPCSQEQTIKEIQKDVQLSKERDILQTEQIKMLKDGIEKIDLKVDKIDAKIDKFVAGLEQEYAKKTSVDRLWSIVWTIIAFVFIAIGGVIVAMVKYFLSLNI